MAKKLNAHLVTQDGESNLTIYHDGETYLAHESHPCWDKLVAGMLADDPKVLDLFDIATAVGRQAVLSDRITYARGHLFVDGDEITDGLATHIIRMAQAGEEYGPFVLLLENILQNPSQNSRDQLYRYIDRHHITITENGELVLYKYVNKAGNHASGKLYCSDHAGPGTVNGEQSAHDHIYQSPGDVVTLARSKVVDNPNEACSSGLHVGAWGYVATHADVRLEIRVHPRDVVSVPRDASEQKIRVCRYTIVGEITKPYDEPVLKAKVAQVAPKPAPKAEPSRTATVRHPSKSAFRTMRVTAKARKKGFIKMAQRAGWTLLQGDGSKREDWSIR